MKNCFTSKRLFKLSLIIVAFICLGTLFSSRVLAFNGNIFFSGTGNTVSDGATIIDGQTTPFMLENVYGATVEIFNSSNRTDRIGNFLFIDSMNGITPANIASETYNYIVIQTQEGTEFRLGTIGIGNYYLSESSVKVEGYRDGVLIGSVNLNLDPQGTVTLFSGGNGLNDYIFNYVDQVFISSNTPEAIDLTANISSIGLFDTVPMNYPLMTPDTTENDVDHNLEITFTPNQYYEASIYKVTAAYEELTAGTQYTVSSGKITLIPSGDGATPLKLGGFVPIQIYAYGYEVTNNVYQQIYPGRVDALEVYTQPQISVDQESGTYFSVPPLIKLKDQYGNLCGQGVSSEALVTASAKNGTGTWTLGGVTSKNASYGSVTLDMMSCTKLTNGTGQITFTVDDVIIDSQPFTLPLFAAKGIMQQQTPYFDVDHDLTITFTEDAYFESNITELVYNGNVLVPNNQYVVTSGKITLFPSATDNNFLRVAPQQTYLYVKANGYKDSIAFMEICPGTATQMIVATQPVAGAQNGDLLSIQPKIELRDQYDNLCIYGVSSYLYLTAGAVNETGVWTLSGSDFYLISGGVANLSGLRANVTTPGTGRIRFTILNDPTLTVDSEIFDLFFEDALLSDLKFDGISIPNFTPQQYSYDQVEVSYSDSQALAGDYSSLVTGIPAQTGGVAVTSHSAIDFSEIVHVEAPTFRPKDYIVRTAVNYHSLSDILVDGVLIEGFNKYARTYSLNLPSVETEPVVLAHADHPEATVSVTVTKGEGTWIYYDIRVSLAGTEKFYTVALNVEVIPPQPPDPDPPVVDPDPPVVDPDPPVVDPDPPVVDPDPPVVDPDPPVVDPDPPVVDPDPPVVDPDPPVVDPDPPVVVPPTSESNREENATDTTLSNPSSNAVAAVDTAAFAILEKALSESGESSNQAAIDKNLNTLLTEIDQMENSKELTQSLSNVSKLVGTMGNNLSSGTQDKELTIARVTSISEVVEKKVLSQTDFKEAVTVVDEYLTELKKVKSGLGESALPVEKAVISTLQKLVDRHSTVKIEAPKDQTSVPIDVQTITTAIDKQVMMQAEINKLSDRYFGESNVNKINTKLTLSIEKASQSDAVTAVIPAAVFDKLKENQINQLMVSIGNVGLTLNKEIAQNPESISVKMTFKEGVQDTSATSPVRIVEFDVYEGEQKKDYFAQPIELSFKLADFGLSKEDKNELGIFRYDPVTAVWNPVGGIVDSIDGTIRIQRSNLSQYTVMKSKKSFSDVNNSWAKNEINSLLSKGIVKSSQTFEPTAYLTRGEFASWIANAFGIQSDTSVMPFKDVNQEDEHYKAIASVYEKGIIIGKSKTKFDPKGYITEQEMAVIMGQTLVQFGNKKNNNKTQSKYLSSLKEKGVSEWASEDMAMLMEFGLKTSESLANGSDFVTKETAAVSFLKMYN